MSGPLRSPAELRLVEEKKNAAGIVTQQRYYEDDKLVEHRLYNQDGKLSTLLRYQYPAPGRVISINYSVKPEEQGRILKHQETEGKTRVRSWIYREKPPYTLEYIENYDAQTPSRVLSKDYLDEKNKLKATITFTYQEGREKPTAFVEKTPEGKILSRYSLFEKYDVPARLKQLGKSPEEIQALTAQRENPDKFLVAIIDTGFDYNHADLVAKWWNNPDDPIDGIDNDGNGWVDDNFGWEQNSNQYLPSENVSSFAKDLRPLSHGTHVAAIASRGLDNIGLIGFAGEYTTVEYIDKISAFLKRHKVRIVNMSLAIPMDYKDQLGMRPTVKAYQRMIESNPETLFVVASGNEIKDLDVLANRQYPSSFRQANVMTVGALNVARFEDIQPGKTAMAYFSNWGKKSVDVLAPGMKVSAAGLGGGLIEHTGTSMATPYVVNQIVRLWSKMPHLKAGEIHALFTKTAHKMNPPPAIISEGYLDLKAATFTGFLENLLGQRSQSPGPNCWNSTLVLSGIASGVHYTTDDDFRHIIESPLCRPMSLDNTQKGDIIALRRFDAQGKILPLSFLSEVHGYLDLGDGTGFTKNGHSVQAPYEIQRKSDILNFYKSQEFKNCKILGLDKKDCILKETAYRCQSLRDYFAGKLSTQESLLLTEIETLEVEIGAEFLQGDVVAQREARLDALQEKLRLLANEGNDLFINILGLRLKSLKTRL